MREIKGSFRQDGVTYINEGDSYYSSDEEEEEPVSKWKHNLCDMCGEGYNVGQGSSCKKYCHDMCRPSRWDRLKVWWILWRR